MTAVSFDDDLSALPYGLEGPVLVPGSSAWLKTISASKVAAILGLSPWESRFSTWHLMNGTIAPAGDTDEKRRGHYLEPAICAWFADQHPDWRIETTGTWTNPAIPGWTAAPDRKIILPSGEVFPLEAKSANRDDQWGTEHTDQVPIYYRVQGVVQCAVMGVRRVHFAMLDGFLTFREYVVDFDPAEFAVIRATVDEFMGSLTRGERPDIDEHSRTYEVLRELVPGIDGTDHDLDPDLAERYCRTRAYLTVAEAAHQLAKSQVLDAMGEARRARHGGRTIATRQVRNDRPAHLVAGRDLPTFPGTSAA